MNFKIVKLVAFSVLFFAILFATSMLMVSNHAAMNTGNMRSGPTTVAKTELTGDPVGGGWPDVQNITC